MKRSMIFITTVILLGFLPIFGQGGEETKKELDLSSLKVGESIRLPSPQLRGKMSLEEALAKRRSIRSFSGAPLTLEQISQLLWAAQGITEPENGLRTAPSAGAPDYPYDIHIVSWAGVFLYVPKGHQLIKVKNGDLRSEIASAAEGQSWLKEAGLIMVLSATYEYTEKYGERGKMFVHIEAGHIAQNVLLQAVSLNLGSVPVGSLYPDKVKALIPISKSEVIYLIPIGHPIEGD